MVLVNIGFNASGEWFVADEAPVAYCSSARPAIFWKSMMERQAQEAKKKKKYNWTVFALCLREKNPGMLKRSHIYSSLFQRVASLTDNCDWSLGMVPA